MNNHSSLIKSLCVCVCIIIFTSSQSIARQGFEDYSYTSIQSPNAYSLGKFGDIPVSKYTGIPNISVPLTSVEVAGFTLPISIDYHASGIKVQEVASWVGLGWALNAGGVITQSVRADNDFDPQGNFHVNVPLDDIFTNPLGSTAKDWYNVYLDRPDGWDSEPDVFFFNFAGRSGKFMFPGGQGSVSEPNIEVVTLPHSNFKFEITLFDTTTVTGIDGEIKSIQITDEQGIKYLFDKLEIALGSKSLTAPGGAGDTDADIKSWYLSKITFPNTDETIQLTYTDLPVNWVFFSSSSEKSYTRTNSIGDPTYKTIGDSVYGHSLTGINYSQTIVYQNTRRLKSIETNAKKIVFETSSTPDRLDSPGLKIGWGCTKDVYNGGCEMEKVHYKLNRIREFNKTNSGDIETRSWNFNFGYFDGNISSELGFTDSPDSVDLFKRLKLESVDFSGSSNNVFETYTFEYNENKTEYKQFDYDQDSFIDFQASPYNLSSLPEVTLPPYFDYSDTLVLLNSKYIPPYKHAPAYDHWGHFNGAFSNHPANIPYYEYGGVLNEVDREVNENFAKHGTLTKIIYPTGGYTEFKYESNEFDTYGDRHLGGNNFVAGGLRVREIQNYDGMGGDPVLKRFYYSQNYPDTSQSSGSLVSAPFYKSPYVVTPPYGGPPDVPYYNFKLSETSLIPLGTTQGGIVGYKEVTVLGSDNDEFGYEKSYYASVEHFPDTAKGFYTYVHQDDSTDMATNEYNTRYVYYFFSPYAPIYKHSANMLWGMGNRTSMDYRRGRLDSVLTYNSLGQKLSKVKNSYQYAHKDTIKAVSVYNTEIPLSCIGHVCNDTRPYQSYAIHYEVISSWNYLKEQENIVYDPGFSGSELITSTRYEYDPGHLQLTKQVEINSNSKDSVATEYEYAHTINRSGINYTAMEGLNLFSHPYSVTVKNANSNTVLSKKWMKWSNSITGASGKWQPSEYWVWDTGTAPSDPGTLTSINTFKINEYDSYGNVLKVEDALGEETRFYYGSNASPFSQLGINGINGMYLTAVQKVVGSIDTGTGCTNDDLCSEGEYNNLGQLTKLIDENGEELEFSYDSFGRLKTQENPNGFVSSEYEYVYSSDLNNGVFDSSEPNKVVSTTITNGPGFIQPTSTAVDSVWDDTTYDVSIDGERAMRVGFNGGGWDGFAEYTTFTKGIAKADIYIGTNITSGAAIPFYIRSLDNNNVFAVRYNPTLSNFQAWSKKNGSWVSPVTLGVTAEKGKWYTVEFVRGDNQTQADLFIYPKGGERDYTTKYTGTGFPSDWTTHVQSSGGLSGGYYYVANISAGERIQAVTYTDGLGKEIQTQKRGGTETILAGTVYNERGLPEATSRPFTKTNQYAFLSDLFGSTFSAPGVVGSSSDLDNYYDGTSGGANYPYAYTKYENSPLAREIESHMPGGSTYDINTAYGLNTSETFTINGKTWGVNTLHKTIIQDQEGNETITYTDGWGQNIVSGVNRNPSSDDALTGSDLITKYEYDLRGNLVRVEDPRELVTSFTYNSLGQQIEKDLPDLDNSYEYTYDDKGRLRFTKNASHKQSGNAITITLNNQGSDFTEDIDPTRIGKLSFNVSIATQYDDFDVWIADDANGDEKLVADVAPFDEGWSTTASKSMVVSPGNYKVFGEAQNGWDGWETSSGTIEFKPFSFSYTKYDDLNRPIEIGEYYGASTFSTSNANTATFPTSDNQKLVEYKYDQGITYTSANNTKGRVSETWYYNPNDLAATPSKTFYSYNSLGLVEWVGQKISGLSGTHFIRYTYDEIGRVTQVHYDSPNSGEDFYYWYDYDELGRLQYISSNENSSKSSAVREAEYTYYADGQIKQLKLGPQGALAQTVDYTYTVQGWLDKINNGNVSASAGGDRFSIDLDYTNSGNVSKQVWMQSAISTTLASTYNYKYDEANRLDEACYDDEACNATAYDVDYSYDANGNIISISRYNENGNRYEANYYSNGDPWEGGLGINIKTGSNRIDRIFRTGTGIFFDKYTYDARGNILESDLQGLNNNSYDWRNLATWSVANGSALLYKYDGDGNRVKKQVVDGGSTYYIRDASGQTIAAHDDNGLVYWVLPGGLGIINY